MIIYNSRFARLLGVNGITLYPFIFIADSFIKCSPRVLRHEQIHIKQQKDWFIIPFYIVYIWDYILGRIKGLNHREAYRNIRFEIEAYKEN
jgi:hypothetical protein